jgi:hypothetical protein
VVHHDPWEDGDKFIDVEEIRAQLRKLSDAELICKGPAARQLVSRVGGNCKPIRRSLNASRTRFLRSSQHVATENESAFTVTTGGTWCLEQRIVRSFSLAVLSTMSGFGWFVSFSLRTRVFQCLLTVCHHL